MELLRHLLRRCAKHLLFCCYRVFSVSRFLFYERIFFKKKIIFEKKTLSQAKFIAIIASYPIKGCVSKNLMDTIQVLNDYGVQVVFVSTIPLSSESLKGLKDVCAVIIEQKNFGRDFGSYKTGFEYLKSMEFFHLERVIFMNDSCLVIPDNFKKTIGQVLKNNTDFIGMTENYKSYYHVSAFFFVVSEKVFQSKHFQQYWETYKRMSDRIYAIHAGEIRLTQSLASEGVYPHVLFSSTNILQRTLEIRKNVDIKKLINTLSVKNNTHFFAFFLVEEMGFPFIKKDLVKRDIIPPVELDFFLRQQKTRISKESWFKIVKANDTIRSAKGIKRILMRDGIL